jgi:hypothetical protein
MINPDGSNEVTLFTEVAHGGPFIWSPDGTKVTLHSQRGGAGNFDIFATFGEVAEEQTPGPNEAQEEETPEEAPAPQEVGSPSEATTAPAVEAASNNIGFITVVGVSLLVVVGFVIFYGLRKFRRNERDISNDGSLFGK